MLSMYPCYMNIGCLLYDLEGPLPLIPLKVVLVLMWKPIYVDAHNQNCLTSSH